MHCNSLCPTRPTPTGRVYSTHVVRPGRNESAEVTAQCTAREPHEVAVPPLLNFQDRLTWISPIYVAPSIAMSRACASSRAPSAGRRQWHARATRTLSTRCRLRSDLEASRYRSLLCLHTTSTIVCQNCRSCEVQRRIPLQLARRERAPKYRTAACMYGHLTRGVGSGARVPDLMVEALDLRRVGHDRVVVVRA